MVKTDGSRRHKRRVRSPPALVCSYCSATNTERLTKCFLCDEHLQTPSTTSSSSSSSISDSDSDSDEDRSSIELPRSRRSPTPPSKKAGDKAAARAEAAARLAVQQQRRKDFTSYAARGKNAGISKKKDRAEKEKKKKKKKKKKKTKKTELLKFLQKCIVLLIIFHIPSILVLCTLRPIRTVPFSFLTSSQCNNCSSTLATFSFPISHLVLLPYPCV